MSTQEPLNTSSISSFIQTVKQADAGQAKEVRLTMQQAKSLAFTLGIVMSRLQGDLERFVKENNTAQDNTPIQVELDGGNSW